MKDFIVVVLAGFSLGVILIYVENIIKNRLRGKTDGQKTEELANCIRISASRGIIDYDLFMDDQGNIVALNEKENSVNRPVKKAHYTPQHYDLTINGKTK